MNSLKARVAALSIAATLFIFMMVGWLFYDDQADYLRDEQYGNIADFAVLMAKENIANISNADVVTEEGGFNTWVDEASQFWGISVLQTTTPIFANESTYTNSKLTSIITQAFQQENVSLQLLQMRELDIETVPEDLINILALENIELLLQGEPLQLISLHLSSNQIINLFTVLENPSQIIWDADFIALAFLLLILTLILNLWMASVITKPLLDLGKAAEQFGKDLQTPWLEEKGVKEVAAASRAFNRMQGHITQLIQGRTQMLAAISHDIRTPVTRLKLRAALLSDEKLQQKFESDLDEITQMVDATLDFLRNDALSEPLETLDFKRWINDLCQQRIKLGEAITIKQLETCQLRIRPLAMKRVVDNVINNGLNYGKQVDVKLLCNDQKAILVFEDQGSGIPEKLLQEVTKPFVRVDQARNKNKGGAGLGLAIVESIVQLHNGELKLMNMQQGLRVEIHLPL